jgi:signal transduction histidine kinase
MYSFRNEADLIFDNIMESRRDIVEILSRANREDPQTDILREKLYKLLEDKYRYFKVKYNVRQVHFHLPKAISFLRMHKPSKFGDSLWGVRPSLREVHNTRKVVRGFEEGRIFNGFRNIYPIFQGEEYIGSVEVSFSFQSIRSQAMELLPYHYKFMISNSTANIVWKSSKNNNYSPSDLSDSFYYDSEANKRCDHPKHNDELAHTISHINKELNISIQQDLNEFKRFAKYIEHDDSFFTVSFIPISSVAHKDSAYFIAYEVDNHFIRKEFSDMKRRIGIFTVALLVSLTLIYLVILKELELRALNRSLEIRIADEIKSSRQKDKVIIQQSKLSAMAEMINSIAHQWRQPLNRISLEVINIEEDFLYDELSEESLMRYSEGINQNVQYLSKTIDDFRDFYRPREGGDVASIVDLIESVVNIIDGEFKSKQISLNFNNQLSEPFTVDHAKDFKQVLVNIITNSIDSIESVDRGEGEIDILLESSNSDIKLTIHDNGKGIEKEIADRVFEPYFTTKFENQGTGMGLYISKITIETNMGGHIYFKHGKEVGTECIIKLPKDGHSNDSEI